MATGSRHPRDRWRLSLQPDPQDAVEKALRHSRFDLFYGPHYLRFTKTRGDDGTIRLRLLERARLVDHGRTDPQLRTAEQLSSLFVHEEIVPRPRVSRPRVSRGPGSVATVDDQQLHDFGRAFFDRAARMLDAYDQG